MDIKKVPTELAETVVAKVNRLAPFGKFERITAGFCIAIPFLLLVADDFPKGKIYILVIPVLLVFFPFLIPSFLKITKNRKNYGMAITAGGGVILFFLYLLFSCYYGLESMPSISDYVNMKNAHIFGMLLSIAAMLFMASGVFYWDKKGRFKEGSWRSIINIFLGIFLLGVVVFHLDRMPVLHMIFALLFFAFCGLGTLIRETKMEKRIQHRIVDFSAVIIMVLAMFIHFGQEWNWFSGKYVEMVNLFGAESIALWVVGLDFMLVSLNRDLQSTN